MPKIRIGSPLQNHEINNNNWNSIEIFDRRRLLWSIGTGLILASITSFIFLQLNPASLPLGRPTWTEFAIFFIILSIGHETLHLLAFPRFGFDANTVAGIWVEFGSPYVQYLLPMQRNKFILACAMPFIVLTLAPLILVAGGFGLTENLSWMAVLNSIGAGSDILILIKLLSTVPSNAWVLENGEKMHWRLADRDDVVTM